MTVIQILAISLSSFGAIMSLALAIFLLFTRYRGDRFLKLTLVLVIGGLSLRTGKSVFNEFMPISDWVRNIGIAGFLLVGPGAYLFIKRKLHNIALWETDWRFLLHLMPFAVFALSAGWIPNNYSTASYAIYALLLVHGITYLLFALVNVLQFYRHTPNARQDGELIFLVFCLAIFVNYVAVFSGFTFLYLAGALIFTLFIVWLCYQLMSDGKFLEVNKNRAEWMALKNCMNAVIDVVRDKQAFKNSKLRIDDVAHDSGYSTREVSEAINKIEHTNFSDFINQARCEFATELMKSDRGGSKLFAIATESGFGNTVSFNKAFKKHFNTTPSEYRKSYKQS